MSRPARTTDLSKASILDAALKLADANGIEAVTMRRIAEVLGVSQMAAYRHVRTKDEIVASLGEYAWQVLEAELDPALEWREQLKRIFTHMHATHREHPGLVDILLARPVGGLPVYRTMERLTEVLRTAGFTLEESIRVLASLESYTFGFTVHQRIRAGRDHARERDTIDDLPPEEFPNLYAAASILSDWSSEERFIAGLDWFIESLHRELNDRD